MGSPVAEWYTKPLRATQDNICPKLSRGLQNAECQKISSTAGESLRTEAHRALRRFSKGLRCNGCDDCNGYQLHTAVCNTLGSISASVTMAIRCIRMKSVRPLRFTLPHSDELFQQVQRSLPHSLQCLDTEIILH